MDKNLNGRRGENRGEEPGECYGYEISERTQKAPMSSAIPKLESRQVSLWILCLYTGKSER
jgi:hypothetical protein